MYGQRSLYDSYQLDNSRVIPLYQGDTGRESIMVAQHNQGLYDQALSGAIGISGNLDNVASLDKDAKLAEELKSNVKSKLDEMAGKGDYENMVPQVVAMGQDFANKASKLARPLQQYQAWAATLDDKDLGLNSSQKETFKDMALSQYKGLNKDYSGGFSGITPDKNIDVNKKVDDAIKGIAETIYADEIIHGQDGQWIVKRGEKTTKVESARIQSLLDSALANDPEYVAYSNMMGNLNGYTASKNVQSADQLPDVDGSGKPNTLKADALKLSEEKGISFKDALRQVVETGTKSGIYTNAMNYAKQKYQKDNFEGTKDIKANELWMQDREHQWTLEAGNNPFMVQGPNTKVTEDEADPHKITAKNAELTTNAADLDKKITYLEDSLADPKLTPDARAQINSDISTLKGQQAQTNGELVRNDMIIGYTRNVAAQKMGYSDYGDYLNKQSVKLATAVKAIYPSGVKSLAGKSLSVDEIARAILTKQFTTKQINDYTVDIKIGGVTFKSTDPNTPKLLSIIKSKNKYAEVGKFENTWEATHKAAAEDFSIKNTVIGLDKSSADQLSTVLRGGAGGLKFTEPGQYQKEDAPADFDVLSVSPIGKDNEVVMQVQTYTMDGKTRVKDKIMDVHAEGSNIGDKLSDIWLRSGLPESKRMANMIRSGSGARLLLSAPIGTKLGVGPTEEGVTIRTTMNNGSVNYGMYDKDGNIISNDSGQYITTNPAEAGEWIDQWNGSYKDEPRIVPGQRVTTTRTTTTTRRVR